jgi:tetratricopeptide (TPR) repeat protein
MLTHPWRYGILFFGTLYFGLPALRIFPLLMRLLAALISGSVKWPGPIVHDPDPQVNMGRRRFGLRSEHLFTEFIFYTLGLLAAFVFLISILLSGTSLLSRYIVINWNWEIYLFIFVAFMSGGQSSNKLEYFATLVNRLLTDLTIKGEPRRIDGLSAESEYAIEHPLADVQTQTSDNSRALNLFSESTTYYQNGDRQRAAILYQEALKLDPDLHKHAREALSEKAQTCTQNDAGSIYYWLGAHSEYLNDRIQAKTWYEKAVISFNQLEYPKREARAHCNLGNVKMQMHDPTAMDEFEKAIALNPRNGTAHINIGTIYYGISERGDPRFDRALDAFADAIVSDPKLYGPEVVARLRSIGYTWKEDLEDISQRVANRQH